MFRLIPLAVAFVFLSTLSLRRATRLGLLGWLRTFISIHALLAESDSITGYFFDAMQIISIHALLAESDPYRVPETLVPRQFLSTLSLRRATSANCSCHSGRLISIHALLAESDEEITIMNIDVTISIHALLAESDCIMTTIICTVSRFLSTLSLRRATSPPDFCYLDNIISIHALLAESDPTSVVIDSVLLVFLSTLSLRRATATDAINGCNPDFISIHALLAESDLKTP